MQIFIQSGCENGKIPEWGLMEFQGSFQSRNEGEPIFNEYLGDLNYTKDGTPFFISGHHILYGQEVKLQKPMAIMIKNTEECHEKQYLVKAVIRKKIIFKSRPKPIIPSRECNGKDGRLIEGYLICPINYHHIFTENRKLRYLGHVRKCMSRCPGIPIYVCVFNASHFVRECNKLNHLMTCPARTSLTMDEIKSLMYPSITHLNNNPDRQSDDDSGDEWW